MCTLDNPTGDSDIIIVFVNFSKQNSFIIKAYFTPALGSLISVSKADYQS